MQGAGSLLAQNAIPAEAPSATAPITSPPVPLASRDTGEERAQGGEASGYAEATTAPGIEPGIEPVWGSASSDASSLDFLQREMDEDAGDGAIRNSGSAPSSAPPPGDSSLRGSPLSDFDSQLQLALALSLSIANDTNDNPQQNDAAGASSEPPTDGDGAAEAEALATVDATGEPAAAAASQAAAAPLAASMPASDELDDDAVDPVTLHADGAPSSQGVV